MTHNITPQDFKNNIEIKTQKTKGDIARELYPQDYYNWDCALPHDWVLDFTETVKLSHGQVCAAFVWLYAGTFYSGPGPLSIEACNWLEAYNQAKGIV